ncbi:TraR/DksA C4-type zinc finger protein [Pseudomonas indica]|uniref:Phage/conjugal plasmid C-4 type zinc finger protein, TraR family n=1 Tax=Pseudomonas indica TaxID=137658 RepID=A0A1G8V3D8_9PSED|nr:TraR/DksA C4-type zinc finger protein [Pseudomonas indica]SDJ60509.1 phage/conjugal plasmid C-4 type zinc finger protein, TraR family [Pseudomonas indica]
MADRADIASELEQERLSAIFAARQPSAGGVSALSCDSCGGDIPEARRVAAPGCRFCVECQDWIERGAW